MGKIADRVYHQLHSTIPEEILGKMSVAVSVVLHISSKMHTYGHTTIQSLYQLATCSPLLAKYQILLHIQLWYLFNYFVYRLSRPLTY